MTTEMTPEQRIDAALDSVLRAAGSALKHYTMPGTLEEMRGAKHEIRAAISETSILWFKRKARSALAAHRKQGGE